MDIEVTTVTRYATPDGEEHVTMEDARAHLSRLNLLSVVEDFNIYWRETSWQEIADELAKNAAQVIEVLRPFVGKGT